VLLLRLDFQIIVGDLAWRKCVAPIAPATYRVSEWAEVSRRLNTNRRIDHKVFDAPRLPRSIAYLSGMLNLIESFQ